MNAPATSPNAIQVDKLSLRMDHTTLLQDINLHIPAGSVVGLVGRNGAGKSSLLRCLTGLTGLTDPSSGNSALLGCPSLYQTDAVRERLGYVAQTPDLIEWMEVTEMINVIGSAYPRWNETRALALAVDRKWARCDALVNNAGTTKFVAAANLEGLSALDYHDIYAVNVIGVDVGVGR